MEFKVFISYSTKDLKNVEELHSNIADSPVEVFIAEHSVKAGEHLSEQISTAINECDLFVVLWSSNAQASEWVFQEIGRAHALNKPILPLVLDKDLHLPEFIQDLKYLPVCKDSKEALKEARALILELYEENLKKEQAQKSREILFWIAVGGLLLWAFSQKSS